MILTLVHLLLQCVKAVPYCKPVPEEGGLLLECPFSANSYVARVLDLSSGGCLGSCALLTLMVFCRHYLCVYFYYQI